MPDVFLSYAQVDNSPAIPDDDSTRWINTFRRSLTSLLDQELGRKGATDLWMDLGDLPGHGAVPPKIVEAIDNSSTLLVMLSRGYLESEWCRQERELFFRAAANKTEAQDRVFLIQLTDIPRNEWPDEFADLVGYTFYRMDPETKTPMRLGYPAPDPQEKSYFRRLNKLGAELGSKLVAIKDQRTAPATPNDEAFKIYLAKGTPDLDEDRDAVSAYLAGRGNLVLPQRHYDPAPDDYFSAMSKDVGQSSLFVQLLGPYATFRTDEHPHGYEGLQLQCAESNGLPIVRWIRKDLNLDAIPDPAHRKFIGSGVAAMDLEDLKLRLGDEIERLQLAQSLPAGEDGEKLVLLHANRSDGELVEKIGHLLSERDLGYEVLDEDTPLDKAAQSHEYGDALLGLMVVYGLCPVDWLKNQLRALRRLVMGKKDRAPTCGVYLGPSDNGKFLPIRFKRLHVVDDESIDPFLNSLAGGKATP